MAEEGSLNISECNIVYPWIFIMCTSCGLNHLPSLLHLEEIIMSKKEYTRYRIPAQWYGFNKSPVCLNMR